MKPSPRGKWLSAALLLVALGQWPALSACVREIEPVVVTGVDACRHCAMLIDDARQAAGYIDEEARKFVTFDSPACLLGHLDALRQGGGPQPSRIFFAEYEDGALLPAEATTFLLSDHLPTVMSSGVLGFRSPEAAGRLRTRDDELITDWLGLRTALSEPDRTVEVSFGSDGMAPDRVSVDKGQLVVFRLRDQVPNRELVVAVEGYPEVERVRLSQGREATLRVLATRPGSGFPIVDAESGETLGALVVRGPHTLDEAAQHEGER